MDPAETNMGLFEQRKQDHIRIANDPRVQAKGLAGFEMVSLIPEALPELDFADISLETKSLNQNLASPIFISSMTAGHEAGKQINSRLANLSHSRNILMGVGSQRKELVDPTAGHEWKEIRKQSPKAKLVSNIGIAQLIHSPIDSVLRLTDSLEAVGIFVHLNALQECLQPEGTPQFKGGLEAIANLVKKSNVPVIIKEVGCGFSENTLKKLEEVGVAAIDVSGLGGTHWGRIEGIRSKTDSGQAQAAEAFRDWGLPTVQSLDMAAQCLHRSEIWASGGVRSGLDVAKCIAMGANLVGIAQPFLSAAIESEEALANRLDQFEFELKIALFCSGAATPQGLRTRKGWRWI